MGVIDDIRAADIPELIVPPGMMVCDGCDGTAICPRCHGEKLIPIPVSTVALAAVTAAPEKSSRVLAAEHGVSKGAIHRAKTQVPRDGAPDAKVTGKDGKSYPARREPKPEWLDRGHVWTDAEIEAETGQKVATDAEAWLTDFRAVAKRALEIEFLKLEGVKFTAQDRKTARAVIKAWQDALPKLGGKNDKA